MTTKPLLRKRCLFPLVVRIKHVRVPISAVYTACRMLDDGFVHETERSTQK